MLSALRLITPRPYMPFAADEGDPTMRRFFYLVSAVLALVAVQAWSVQARVHDGATMNMSMGTASSEPVILGVLTDSDSHSIGVLTPEGERLQIEFDSRTVMAATPAMGSRVRVDFERLDNGLLLARRVTPLEAGSTDWNTLDNRIAQADADEDMSGSGTALASYSGDNDNDKADKASTRANAGSAQSSTTTSGGTTASSDTSTSGGTTNDHDADDPGATSSSSLPRTAGQRPLAAAIGLGLLALAAGLSWARRRRVA
jgi:hypothetical protein